MIVHCLRKVHSEADTPFSTDNFMISCGLKSSGPSPTDPLLWTNTMVFDYSKVDWDSMCSYLLDQDFSMCYEEENVELIWLVIKNTVLSAMELFIPKVRLRKNQFPRWYNAELRHQFKCLKSLERKCENYKNQSLFTKLSKAELAFRSHAEQVKGSYESELITNLGTGNSSAVFRYIRDLKEGSGIPRTIFLGSTSASSTSEKASLFNVYFHSIFTDSDFELPDLDVPIIGIQTLNTIEFSESDVYRELLSLDITKAKGLDGIGPSILKYCALALYQPLCRLFQLSVDCHIIPMEWKIHAITPIFKTGDKSQVSNYRPISLLSTTFKVLEKLIYTHLSHHLQGMLSGVQFGFRSGHSSVQQLLLFYSKIVGGDSMITSQQWDIAFMDFSKVFDSVSHNELLLKLHRLGVSGHLWQWLKCYLLGRSQCVCLDETRSTILPVLSGVPQGSVLGPLLFLAFVNDLPDVVKHSIIYMYADDLKCAKPIRCISDCSELQNDLDSLCSWSANWKLSFKESKCVLLRCHSSRLEHIIDFNYRINDVDLLEKDKHSDLGVLFTSNMSFSAHYSHITSKAYRILGLLRRTFKSCTNINEKKLLYTTLVKSQLMYCSVLWRPFLKKDIELLERVQRRATKYILNDYHSDYKSRLISLQILPLMYVYELQDIFFTVSNLKSPSRDFDMLQFVQFSGQNTRSSHGMKMSHRRANNNISKHNFFNRIPRLWNALPPIDIEKSMSYIKSQLQEFLYNHFQNHFDPNFTCSFHFICPCSKCSNLYNPPSFLILFIFACPAAFSCPSV